MQWHMKAASPPITEIILETDSLIIVTIYFKYFSVLLSPNLNSQKYRVSVYFTPKLSMAFCKCFSFPVYSVQCNVRSEMYSVFK